MATITLTIDGREVRVPQGISVLDAAHSAGIDIPVLCHHPALPPEGACRLCMVQVEGQRGLQPACTFPAAPGMVIQTETPAVVEARRFALNLLLSDHPLDCMTCDAAGDCLLQDLAYQYGVKETDFKGRQHSYAIDRSNPFIQVDRNKCILCRRCVRACNVINGVEAISVVYRGFDAHIAFGADAGMQDSPCEFCGSCVSVCPTAALMPREAIGKGRTWEFERTTTTCSYCGVGCQFEVNVKNGKIVKVTPSWDAVVNKGWTCVKGQFGFDYVNHPDRLTTPLIRRDGQLQPATWDEALDLIAGRLHQIRQESGPDSIAVLASAKATNEENYLLQKMARQVIGTNNIDHCARL